MDPTRSAAYSTVAKARDAAARHWFALNGLGVSVVPINAELRAVEWEYLVAPSEIVPAVALVRGA